MGNLTVWPAPAKINLSLRINGRRDDGYHELQTVFAILDRGDSMTIEPRNDEKINIYPNMGFPPEENIIHKAVRLLCGITGRSLGADIRVDKKIPMGGGLGGGSSDAATALLAFNHIFRLGLSEKSSPRLPSRKNGISWPPQGMFTFPQRRYSRIRTFPVTPRK